MVKRRYSGALNRGLVTLCAALWLSQSAHPQDREPVWSADGKALAYLRGTGEETELRVVSVESGQGAVLQTGDFGAPVWLDRTNLAIAWRQDGEADLWRVPLVKDPVQLTEDPGNEVEPAVGADGRIAFCADVEGDRQVFVMQEDGSEQECWTFAEGIHRSPRWSPDARRIACLLQDKTAQGPFAEYSGVLRIIDLEEDAEVVVGEEGGFDSYGRWSPDGASLVFTTLRERNYEVCRYDLAARAAQNLTSHPAHDFNADYSADGLQLIWIANGRHQPGNADVWIMAVDGSNPRRLTDSPAKDNHPRWSPDGKTIAFLSNRDGEQHELFLMNADGGNVRRAERPAAPEAGRTDHR